MLFTNSFFIFFSTYSQQIKKEASAILGFGFVQPSGSSPAKQSCNTKPMPPAAFATCRTFLGPIITTMTPFTTHASAPCGECLTHDFDKIVNAYDSAGNTCHGLLEIRETSCRFLNDFVGDSCGILGVGCTSRPWNTVTLSASATLWHTRCISQASHQFQQHLWSNLFPSVP